MRDSPASLTINLKPKPENHTMPNSQITTICCTRCEDIFAVDPDSQTTLCPDCNNGTPRPENHTRVGPRHRYVQISVEAWDYQDNLLDQWTDTMDRTLTLDRLRDHLLRAAPRASRFDVAIHRPGTDIPDQSILYHIRINQ